MIEVRGLTKLYGTHVAISDVSFTAEKGEILGFLGPNGAGKTTTMRILTCYLPPSAGTARVAGFDILDNSMEVRRRVGYLPENVPLYTDLSVADYLDFVARLKGMSGRDRLRRCPEVMEECGVAHVSQRQIGKLSRGYRQRVGLAQALVNNPEVLVLDEPTVGLDPKQIIEIRELIRRLAGRRTIILSTHILPEASLLCERVIIVNDGALVTIDTPENLRGRLRRAMVLDVTVRGDSRAVVEALRSVPGVRSVNVVETRAGDVQRLQLESIDGSGDIREHVSRAIVTGGFGLIALGTHDPTLEDIFVHLVTKEETE